MSPSNESEPPCFSVPWYICVLQFVSGLLLANRVPAFRPGISGHWFQTPFASPPGVGKSPPTVNVLWGSSNLAVGFALLFALEPKGATWSSEWHLSGGSALVMALYLARHSAACARGTSGDSRAFPYRREPDRCADRDDLNPEKTTWVRRRM